MSRPLSIITIGVIGLVSLLYVVNASNAPFDDRTCREAGIDWTPISDEPNCNGDLAFLWTGDSKCHATGGCSSAHYIPKTVSTVRILKSNLLTCNDTRYQEFGGRASSSVMDQKTQSYYTTMAAGRWVYYVHILTGVIEPFAEIPASIPYILEIVRAKDAVWLFTRNWFFRASSLVPGNATHPTTWVFIADQGPDIRLYEPSTIAYNIDDDLFYMVGGAFDTRVYFWSYPVYDGRQSLITNMPYWPKATYYHQHKKCLLMIDQNDVLFSFDPKAGDGAAIQIARLGDTIPNIKWITVNSNYRGFVGDIIFTISPVGVGAFYLNKGAHGTYDWKTTLNGTLLASPPVYINTTTKP